MAPWRSVVLGRGQNAGAQPATSVSRTATGGRCESLPGWLDPEDQMVSGRPGWVARTTGRVPFVHLRYPFLTVSVCAPGPRSAALEAAGRNPDVWHRSASRREKRASPCSAEGRVNRSFSKCKRNVARGPQKTGLGAPLAGSAATTAGSATPAIQKSRESPSRAIRRFRASTGSSMVMLSPQPVRRPSRNAFQVLSVRSGIIASRKPTAGPEKPVGQLERRAQRALQASRFQLPPRITRSAPRSLPVQTGFCGT